MVRGEVRRLRIPRGRRGSEQRGARFAVVVQADELLALSTVLVAPTSRSAPTRSFRPRIDVGGETACVLVEQLTAWLVVGQHGTGVAASGGAKAW